VFQGFGFIELLS